MKTVKTVQEQQVGATKSQPRKGLVALIAALLLILVVVGGLQRKESLHLDNLVADVEYHVEEMIENDRTTQVEVRLEEVAEAETVVQAILGEIQSQDTFEADKDVVVHVYQPKPDVVKPSIEKDEQPSVDVETPNVGVTRPSVEEDSHVVTGVLKDKVVKLYTFEDFTDVTPDILTTDTWTLKGSQYQDGHLISEVVILDELEHAQVYSQLKAIESEMRRVNEVTSDKHTHFVAPDVEKVVYSYSSVYPNHLIVETETVIQVRE